MTEFTPWSALLGGSILGVSALLLLIFNGRIAGISGIVSQAMRARNELWRYLFLLGLILGPWLTYPFGFELANPLDHSWGVVLIAGFLVGFGANIGSGCTSGHGICGISRLSIRSIVATLIFMTTAVLTVWLTRGAG